MVNKDSDKCSRLLTVVCNLDSLIGAAQNCRDAGSMAAGAEEVTQILGLCEDYSCRSANFPVAPSLPCHYNWDS